MQIVAKSNVSLEQLKEKRNKGAKYIELHLVEEDVRNDRNFDKIIENIKKSGLCIKVAHTPINRKFTVEGLLSTEGFKIIDNTCKLAEMISKVMGEPIHVVLHQELDLEQFEVWGLYNILKMRLDHILSSYPNVIINFENLMVINYRKDYLEFRNSYSFQNVDLCKKLKKDLKTDRIGTVLDTCHAISSIRALQELSKLGVYTKISLKDYFEKNKNVLNIIHLANARNFGFSIYGEHGICFDNVEEIKLLKKILGYIKEINYKGIVTLEIGEKDYLNCIAFEKTKKQVEKLGGI